MTTILLKIKGYRDHFSWLLLNQDVRRSFESIWQSLNQRQERVLQESAYARWQFDFQAPTSLAGTTMDVRVPFDPESNELLVWEIEKLQELRFSHRGDIFFRHPALKLPVRGENTGCVSVPSGAKELELEVDADEEPTAAKEQRLIHLPVEGVTFDAQLRTKIAYNGDRANGHGKKVDDEQCPSREIQLSGVADPVSEGSIASGEFQQLGEGEGDGDEHERLADRFSLLREILEQITQESGVALVALEVRPLPPVPRCSYHMIDHKKSRCYLLTRFKLQNGGQRFLLERDTSDNRETMSTRIMGFKVGVEAGKCIDRILRETVKGSLRWPGAMAKYCEPLHSVHHPKESSSGANHARVFDRK
ncbi:Tn7-like element transposition protein TnsE [Citrobacter freundii]